MVDFEREERRVFVRKWAGFVSAMWLMVFSGNYAYANYSEALKEVLGINQSHLNGLSVSRDIGDSCGGIIGGILSNYLPPWVLLCIAATFGFLGYGIQWLVVARVIDPLPYWIMAMSLMAAGICIAWMNTIVFNASVRNFSRNRGPVAGLLKACMGLSGAVFSILCSTLFSNLASAYLLMLVTIPNMFCLVSAIFFKPLPTATTKEEEQLERKSIFIFNVIASVLAVYIACLDILLVDLDNTLTYQSLSVSVLLAIILTPAFIPVVLFVKMKRSDTLPKLGVHFKGKDTEATGDAKSQAQDNASLIAKAMSDNINQYNTLKKPLLDTTGALDANRILLEKRIRRRFACAWMCFSRPRMPAWVVEGLGNETPTLSLLKTWHYYVLYFSLFCGCGAGVTFNNNLGQVGESLGYSTVNLFVSLFSLGNFFGRIVSGNVSEYYIRLVGIPRPAWMGLAKVPMIVLFVWLSTGSVASLHVGSLVLGFSHGCFVTLVIPIVSEFYGLKHFSTNFVLTVTYLVTSSYVFSSMAGYLYDWEALAQGNLTCYGAACYGTTFQILAVVLTIALAFDAILTLISRPLYQKMRTVTLLN
ncbi:hypothetical protein GOP47_0011195 [Adiantum capillus-veneris]|uniref:Nodulin-like domain-containing protein n=1 Tax=Adiantum capillus-veneris TaxID=13818 RepID=A0A9D4UTF9_ADICA|nr:hypothetical protein GOP47_0011195 [Adiantum capillus-veneris]